jgi:hypothetical protein
MCCNRSNVLPKQGSSQCFQWHLRVNTQTLATIGDREGKEATNLYMKFSFSRFSPSRCIESAITTGISMTRLLTPAPNFPCSAWSLTLMCFINKSSLPNTASHPFHWQECAIVLFSIVSLSSIASHGATIPGPRTRNRFGMSSGARGRATRAIT